LLIKQIYVILVIRSLKTTEFEANVQSRKDVDFCSQKMYNYKSLALKAG